MYFYAPELAYMARISYGNSVRPSFSECYSEPDLQLSSRYYAVIGSFKVKMVADRHIHAAYRNKH